MIQLGTNSLLKVFLGTTPIAGIYMGSVLIWLNDGQPLPPIVNDKFPYNLPLDF